MSLRKCLNLLVFLQIGLGLVLDIVIDSAAEAYGQYVPRTEAGSSRPRNAY